MIDDGETRFVHDHDGEERHKVSLVLFSHSVSESELIYCNLIHNLFQITLQVCAQDFLRLDRSRECEVDSARWTAVVGVSSSSPFSVAQRSFQHRVCEPQQLSHRCSVCSLV